MDRFFMRWNPEWDKKILEAGKKFKGEKQISWKKADAAGALDGVPKFLTGKDLSHRLCLLKVRDTEEYRAKKRKSNREYEKRFSKEEKRLRQSEFIKKNRRINDERISKEKRVAFINNYLEKKVVLR